jgi:hypothetical protein
MKAIEDFPFEWIARDLRDGKCIPFLGAGASAFPKEANAKPPSAVALALELAKESMYPPYQAIREAGDPSDVGARERLLRATVDCENLMLVSSWVEHGLGDRSRLDEKLREHLADEHRPLPFNALHDLLARVAEQRPMAIITTNYDDLVEAAFMERKVPFDLFVVAIDRPAVEGRAQGITLFRPAGDADLKPVTSEQQLLDLELDKGQVRLKRSALFKIHGHIDRNRSTDDTFVITEEDYVSFLGRMHSGDSVIPADLVTVMQSRSLLFLGYGLRDWNFRVLLDRLNRSRLQPKRSYAISYDIEPAEGELWGARNVVVFKADLNEFVPRLDVALGQTPPSSS